MPWFARVRTEFARRVKSENPTEAERLQNIGFLKDCYSLLERGRLIISRQIHSINSKHDYELRLKDWAEGWGEPTPRYASLCMEKELIQDIKSYECTTMSLEETGT